jgi:hypothetical protein
MNKLIRIIRSRVFRKDDQPNWYYKRLEICHSCKHNSKNVNLNFFQKIMSYLNSLEDFCTICSCQLKAKASEAQEDCGLVGLGKESKWKSINIKNQ